MSRVIVEMEKTGKQVLRKRLPMNRLLWLYGVAAMASFTVFVVFWCTSVFRDMLLSTLELRNGSSALNLWQRPPVNLVYKVYVFNYTNVDEFTRGRAKKLRIQEVGPYVYQEVLTRVNVKMHDNRTVTYQERRFFEWISGRPDDEPVMVPNVPLLGVLAFTRNLNLFMRVSANMLLSTIDSKPFIRVPAGDFIWGYDDRIFWIAKNIIQLKHKVPYEKFGILAFKNGTNDDRITMHTGWGDLGQLGMIQRINGKDDRRIWGDKECDKIYGTDGSMFPPDMVRDLNNTLYVYAKDICRNIPFRYHERSSYNGIPTYRYKMPRGTFTASESKDYCFCSRMSTEDMSQNNIHDDRVCPPAGIFNFSACQFGFPMLASYPHFYQGDPILLQDFDGLQPDPELHETYIDLHQRLSIPIRGWSRFQLNVDVRRSDLIPLSRHLRDGMILPLIWIDSGVEELPETFHSKLYQAHYLANAFEAGLQWCSLVAMLLLFGAFIIELRKEKETTHTSVPSADVEQTKLPE